MVWFTELKWEAPKWVFIILYALVLKLNASQHKEENKATISDQLKLSGTSCQAILEHC